MCAVNFGSIVRTLSQLPNQWLNWRIANHTKLVTYTKGLFEKTSNSVVQAILIHGPAEGTRRISIY